MHQSLLVEKCVLIIQQHPIVIQLLWLLIVNQDIMKLLVNQIKIVIILMQRNYYVKINQSKVQMIVREKQKQIVLMSKQLLALGLIILVMELVSQILLLVINFLVVHNSIKSHAHKYRVVIVDMIVQIKYACQLQTTIIFALLLDLTN